MQGRVKSRFVAACVLLLAALSVAIPAYAHAEPSALEEYVLELPGTSTTRVEPERSRDDRSTVRREGVIGEGEKSPTALAGVGSALASPAGAISVAAVLGAVGFGLRRARTHG